MIYTYVYTCTYIYACVLSHSVVSDTLGPHEVCSLPGSSVHGIFQSRILEQIVISTPRDLPDPGIEYIYTYIYVHTHTYIYTHTHISSIY